MVQGIIGLIMLHHTLYISGIFYNDLFLLFAQSVSYYKKWNIIFGFEDHLHKMTCANRKVNGFLQNLQHAKK